MVINFSYISVFLSEVDDFVKISLSRERTNNVLARFCGRGGEISIQIGGGGDV